MKKLKKLQGKAFLIYLNKGKRFSESGKKKVFKNLINSLPKNKLCFLSVGAGFVFKKEPSWNVIYLCRYSDEMGRIFLNRPRLKALQNPFTEYKSLYKKRNSYYLKQADEVLFRREHFKQLEFSDFLFLGLKKLSQPCFTLRLNPEDVPQNKKQLKLFLQKRIHWGLRFFELNDETAEKDFVKKIQSLVPEDKLLFSSQCSKKFISLKNKKHWSWDLSLGKPPKGVNIIALHERNKKELKDVLKEFSSYKNYHLKLAVEIFNFKELKMAYDWKCKDPENRSFLPRSKEGKWLWFRQAFGSKMFLHFIKERSYHCIKNESSSLEVLDQPFLSEAVPFVQSWKALAGVLGWPVRFSATPGEQNDFFKRKKSVPVLHLPLKEEEMTKQNLKILSEFGFCFFAVTSPLKEKAFLSADTCDELSQKFKTANTLIFHNKTWRTFNTDWNGFQKLKKYSSKNTVVWGGGGIRTVLKECLPLAQFYSARTGRPLNVKKPTQITKKQKSFSPKVLIWAVGRKRMEQGCLMPPKHWKPSKVVDINYTEDSPGLEYAVLVQAQYKNGMELFKEQAKKQRQIFKNLTKFSNLV